MFADLLFTNSNSILNIRLVSNDNLAYQIAASHDNSRIYNEYSNFDIIMQAAMGNAKVKKIIAKEINEIINEGIDQKLIDNYISNFETQGVFENYSNQNISARLGYAEYYYNDYKKHNADLEAFKKIKADDLKQIAQTYFNPEKLKVINCKPVSE